ncbi:MAG: hypothetical protein IKX70_01315 [Treponema sp.]|nr:hypothetical protein [Treponema sp.]
MAYPKPLSEKSISRMYADSKLTQEKIDFLRKFFDSCAALYGSICLNDMWEVYKELSEKTDIVKIQKKDVIEFSSIARREIHDYCVYEIDELYSAEKRVDKDRYVVLRDIIERASLQVFYQLDEMQQGRPWYVPENLLSFKGLIVTSQEKRLIEFIENLKATSPIIKNKWNEKLNKPSPHQGKKLKDFSFLSPDEEFEIEWLSGKCEHGPKKCQQKKLDEYLSTVQGTFAEKIFRDLRFGLFTGWRKFMDQIKHTMDELAESGVELSMDEANNFIQLIQDFVNNSHLYINRGWTPFELSEYGRKMDPKRKPVITLGPEIRKAIENGEVSIEDLKTQAKANGFDIQF